MARRSDVMIVIPKEEYQIWKEYKEKKLAADYGITVATRALMRLAKQHRVNVIVRKDIKKGIECAGSLCIKQGTSGFLSCPQGKEYIFRTNDAEFVVTTHEINRYLKQLKVEELGNSFDANMLNELETGKKVAVVATRDVSRSHSYVLTKGTHGILFKAGERYCFKPTSNNVGLMFEQEEVTNTFVVEKKEDR
jgi:dethiobiotin synthetase